MSNQRKEDRCCRTVPSGYDVGFDMNLYYGVGDAYGEESANGVQKNVHLELWMPFLGALGHHQIGGTYDTSKEGMNEAHFGAMKNETEKIKDPRLRKMAVDLISEKGTKMTLEEIRTFAKYLGKETLILPWYLDWSFKYDKIVIDGISRGYFQMESKYLQEGAGPNTQTFSSYNYGTNVFSHLLIDFFGYYIPRFVYSVK